MIRRVVGIHFSPIGGTADMTKRLTEYLASRLREESPLEITTQTYELMRMGPGTIDLDEETVAVIGMPVYVGKVPLPAVKALEMFNPNGAVAVAAVSFGARTYGNALYELQHYTEQLGFKVVGAGAFSIRYGKHGIFSDTGTYAEDVAAMKEFSKAASAKIMRLAGSEIEGLRVRPAPLTVEGRLPVHITSRVLPRAAAAAQGVLERMCIRKRGSEWYL